MEITIEGLNARQQVLADIIWSCLTAEAVKGFIHGLPTQDQRDEAETIVEMMKVALLEQCWDGRGSMDESQSVLDKIAQR
jgi:hypothetical protein